LIQRLKKDTSRFRIQPPEGLIDVICVHQAVLAQSCRGWVEDVVIDASHIRSWADGMSGSEYVGAFTTSGSVGSEETVWHTVILENATGNIEVQLAIILAPVDEEVDREGRLSISSEDARSDEGESWIRRD